MNPTSSYRVDILWLSLLLALLFSVFLGSRSFMVPDEGRYVEIPREMNLSGDYITPHLNGIKYFEKPPLFYWLEAATLRVVGENEGGARLLPLILGLLGGIMVYMVGRKLYNRRTGILACLLLATSPLYFVFAHMIIPDIALALFFTASMFCFIVGIEQSPGRGRKGYIIAMYGFAGLAVMTKGLVAIILPGGIIFCWMLLTHNWKQLKSLLLPSGILLFFLIALPWHLLVQQRNPEFFHFYFLEQQFLRYATDYAGRNQPLWFMTASILGGFFPWSIFLLALLGKNIAPGHWRSLFQKLRTQAVTVFLLLWVVIVWLFFTFSHSQLVTYVLPLLPALSLLMAQFLDANWQRKRWTLASYCIAIIALLGTVSAIVACIIAPKQAQIYWFISAILLGLTALSCGFFYYYRGFKWAIVALMLGMGLCLISINLNFDSIDNRSVKPLAMKLLPILQPQDEVVAYNNYYQDLPVYLQRRISVANLYGELMFGSLHQAQKDWMIDSAALWQKWRSDHRIFLVIKRKDYANLSQIDSVYHELLHKKPEVMDWYLVGETDKNLLYSNRPSNN